mmetsp:Transcript_10252/g.13898  ORF Transcript_10252/g.13898 Transcript_10252/m.13898 type:complete len:168 (+) Transcript_10252:872-1375(+)|eukprot:CAMPEP_0185592332 /NCGR_PEP_ID=MMETSP0434-20130131/67565_1 /TAXON_ID=626734 ORGANISM="Favella taraikaensis, Strain Fe Narragansett Bay" /NCGR_SAMPLE_ID=MMETSP0434 /ASSEMBLY_ACC=CAM_ASM_000379 /LENGTH=167 /DNA_ID=CAMNT_0028218061 /DNA_START=740 /DNA_END=1243 /DNA_ORIENTATION=-
MAHYERPKIQLMNHNAVARARKKSYQPRKQALHTKVPQASPNKVIVFNFKGNQDLPEEILKRVQLERLQTQQAMDSSGSKPLLLSNNSNNALNMASGVFSPKRNSLNQHDSVSIYTRAKAALATEAGTQSNSRGILDSSSNAQTLSQQIRLREERSRYQSTVRRRLD